MRYSVTLSYLGAGFHGWQIQPSESSVQEALEKALSTLLRSEIAVTGAGRTDTGVNAVRYVAHFDAPEGIDTVHLRYKLNAILPHSVAVLGISPATEDFHARFSATRREYTYFLHRVKDPFVEKHSYMYTFPQLDFDAMNRAASLLAGRHDFRCFEKTGADSRTSLCTVYEAYWAQYMPAVCAGGLTLNGAVSPSAAQRSGDYWFFRISADRFLRNMVRAVTGTLLEVGRGKRSMEDFASLILPVDFAGSSLDTGAPMRSAAGESVPAHALFLSDVKY